MHRFLRLFHECRNVTLVGFITYFVRISYAPPSFYSAENGAEQVRTWYEPGTKEVRRW